MGARLGDRINELVREGLADALARGGIRDWSAPPSRLGGDEYPLDRSLFGHGRNPPRCDAWLFDKGRSRLALVEIEAKTAEGVTNAAKLLCYVRNGGRFLERREVFAEPPKSVLILHVLNAPRTRADRGSGDYVRKLIVALAQTITERTWHELVLNYRVLPLSLPDDAGSAASGVLGCIVESLRTEHEQSTLHGPVN